MKDEQGGSGSSRSSPGGGTYQEAKFEEDADKVVEFYRDQGYIAARVGQPELKVLEDSTDGKTRWIQLRIPVTEGHALPGRRRSTSTATRSSRPRPCGRCSS